MNKAEIISKILKQMGLNELENQPTFGDEQDEEAFVVAVHQDVLLEGGDIRATETARINEMPLIQLADGSPACVCHSGKRALAHTP